MSATEEPKEEKKLPPVVIPVIPKGLEGRKTIIRSATNTVYQEDCEGEFKP